MRSMFFLIVFRELAFLEDRNSLDKNVRYRLQFFGVPRETSLYDCECGCQAKTKKSKDWSTKRFCDRTRGFELCRQFFQGAYVSVGI